MIRAAAVVAALLVAAWFGLGVRQSTSADAASARLASVERSSATAARRTATLIDHAGTLNPDSAVDVLRARLALQRGRIADARRLLLGVVAREPRNVDAWASIALVFRQLDPPLARRARSRVLELSPTVPARNGRARG